MIATMGNVFYFDWEFDLLYWFQGLHNPVLDKIVVAITSLGKCRNLLDSAYDRYADFLQR